MVFLCIKVYVQTVYNGFKRQPVEIAVIAVKCRGMADDFKEGIDLRYALFTFQIYLTIPAPSDNPSPELPVWITQIQFLAHRTCISIPSATVSLVTTLLFSSSGISREVKSLPFSVCIGMIAAEGLTNVHT